MASSTPPAPPPTTTRRRGWPPSTAARTTSHFSSNRGTGLAGVANSAAPGTVRASGVLPMFSETASNATAGRPASRTRFCRRSSPTTEAPTKRAPANWQSRRRSMWASAQVYTPARCPGTMPEYGAWLTSLTKVTRTPAIGRIPSIRNASACACPPPTSTNSRATGVERTCTPLLSRDLRGCHMPAGACGGSWPAQKCFTLGTLPHATL